MGLRIASAQRCDRVVDIGFPDGKPNPISVAQEQQVDRTAAGYGCSPDAYESVQIDRSGSRQRASGDAMPSALAVERGAPSHTEPEGVGQHTEEIARDCSCTSGRRLEVVCPDLQSNRNYGQAPHENEQCDGVRLTPLRSSAVDGPEESVGSWMAGLSAVGHVCRSATRSQR
jgi:hypothetical protein